VCPFFIKRERKFKYTTEHEGGFEASGLETCPKKP
jgi:hypothetical protein